MPVAAATTHGERDGSKVRLALSFFTSPDGVRFQISNPQRGKTSASLACIMSDRTCMTKKRSLYPAVWRKGLRKNPGTGICHFRYRSAKSMKHFQSYAVTSCPPVLT